MEFPLKDLALPLCLATALSCQPKDEQGKNLDSLLQSDSPQCEMYSEALQRIYPDFPTDAEALSGSLKRNLEASGQILKLRYAPNIGASDLQRFSSDFPAYVSDRFSAGRVCMAAGDLHEVVDFVDAFVMDNPAYVSGSTFPNHPNGNYDEARFSTIDLWRNQEMEVALGRTLAYERSFKTTRFPARDLDSSVNSDFAYLPPEGERYEFTITDPYFAPEIPGSVFFGRTSPKDKFSLSVAAEGARYFFRARNECYGTDGTCLWDPD